jgi:hypothetical protein
MSQLIQLKRSAVQGKVPTTAALNLGEIAINTYDGKIYFKKNDGTDSIVMLQEVTENNLAVDTSSYDNSSSAFLAGVLSDLDTAISNISSGSLSSSFSTYEYNVTADQTVFTGVDSNGNTLSYDLGSGTELSKLQVFVNGVLIDNGTDYTATNGTSITLTTAAVDGDVVTIAAYKSISTFQNDLQLADNQKLHFGDDLDLQIYHDGSNSIINEVGTGNLLLQNNTSTIAEVTPLGIDVTGAVTTDTLQLTGGTGTQGTVTWNSDEETLDLVQNDTTLQLGQELVYHVRNNTASTILNGTPVMATGTIGASSRITIAPMDGTNVANADYFLGFATADIPADSDGKVTHFGKVRGIDTSAYNEGDILYISTSAAGQVVTTEPTSGMKLPVAFVITSHASVGTIFVRATNGCALADLHDIDFTGLANNDLLRYDSATAEWKPIASTTTNITEGTNLYYTTTRVNDAIDARVTKEYVDDLAVETTTLVTTTETQIASFSATTYGSAKLIIQATRGSDRHVTELLIVHNGTTASATEYGTVFTNTALFTLDVDINTNNVRILATGASATSTTYKVYKTLIKA